MEVGSDILLSRALRRRRPRRWLGITVLLAAVLVAAGGSVYLLYPRQASTGLPEVSGQAPETAGRASGPAVQPEGGGSAGQAEASREPEGPGEVKESGEAKGPGAADTSGEAGEGTSEPAAPTAEPPAASTGEAAGESTETAEAGQPREQPIAVPQPVYLPAARFAAVSPGEGAHPRYWGTPYWAEPGGAVAGTLGGTFEPLDAGDASPVGSLSRAVRLRVPAIGLDSPVRELRAIDRGDGRAWETPDRAVGHIPTTANAGEAGRGYLFGHLDSPVEGLGDAFLRLPEVPRLLEKGEVVRFVLTNAEGSSFLYEVFRATVVPAEELRLEESPEPFMSLVAPVPRLEYDRRLIVTGRLVGLRRG